MTKSLLSLLIVFFFQLNLSIAQVSGTAKYTVTSQMTMTEALFNPTGDKEQDKKNKELKAQLALIMPKDVKNESYPCTLKFNKHESIFFFDEFLETDDDLNKLDFAYIVATTSTGLIYMNQSSKEILNQKDRYGDQVIIKKSTTDIKWNLENETKQIGKYTCYKATTTKQMYRSDGNHKERKIEAWYAPELIVNIGPIGYSGLPGLIVQLKTGKHLIYELVEIAFDSKDSEKTKIDKPTKGELLTEKEYNESLGSLSDQIRRRRN